MNTVSSMTMIALKLSMLRGIGPATLRKLARAPGFHDGDLDQLSQHVPPLKRAINETGAWERASELAVEQVEAASDSGTTILSALDPAYPTLLSATKDDPFIIYVRGSLAADPLKAVAVIGTREPTPHGEAIADRIARFLTERGWSVVSGLALGCDAIAHRAAIEARGHTVAVLAHGLQTIAPSTNRRLAEDILEAGGALVSEYPFGREPIPQQFVKRDLTQAGMAQGVVMIQSDLQGGSLHASRAALAYGRWLAVPHPTVFDRTQAAPKIQANLMLSEGSEAERIELLRCKVQDLERVVVLRSKEDYPRLVREEQISDQGSAPRQVGLL